MEYEDWQIVNVELKYKPVQLH